MAATSDEPAHKTLRALTSAALALPGMTKESAAATPAERQWDVGYFHYEESGDRMTVGSLRQALTIPIGERLDLTFSGVRDTISGASPIYNLPEIHCADGSVVVPPVRSVSGASGDIPAGNSPAPERPPLGAGGCEITTARQVMLDDTFEDRRTAGDLKLNHYWDDTTLGLGAGISQEKDYDSSFLNLDLRHELNGKLTTLAVGYSLASDAFSPLNRPEFTGDKDTHQFLLGVTQVLSKSSLAQVNLTLDDNRGFLTDPYKNVYVLDTNEAVDEQRPDRRRRWNLLGRYIRHFPDWRSTLHLDYRYSTDDWGVDAHTLEALWIQPVGNGWQLIPRLRYYSQDEADFYQSYVVSLPESGHFSSDYRLAGFGALSGGLKFSKQIGDQARIAAGFELYERKSRYALTEREDSSFADYGFAIYSLSLNLKF